MIDEPAYVQNSVVAAKKYDHTFCRHDAEAVCCAHGVTVESPEAATMILGTGGTTGVHKNSITHVDNICFIAAGDSVFALEVPSLKMVWCMQVDIATCFGVFWVEKHQCLITWGEIFVSCYTKDGKKIWKTSGADIFTQGFKLTTDTIEVVDCNNTTYRVTIPSGHIEKI